MFFPFSYTYVITKWYINLLVLIFLDIFSNYNIKEFSKVEILFGIFCFAKTVLQTIPRPRLWLGFLNTH